MKPAGTSTAQARARSSAKSSKRVGVAPGTFRRDGVLQGLMEKGVAPGYDSPVE